MRSGGIDALVSRSERLHLLKSILLFPLMGSKGIYRY